MIWFTSDTHFGHARILELSNRPFHSIHHMNDEIVKRWNKVVHPDDVVYHLGDVALGPIHESLANVKRLNGEIHLRLGNHDRPFMVASKGAEKVAQWTQTYLDNGFKSVNGNGIVWGINTPLLMSHFPYDGDSHGDERYREARLPDNGIPLVHGHTHSSEVVTRSKCGTLQIHVGMDAWDFRPVSLDEVARILVENRQERS